MLKRERVWNCPLRGSISDESATRRSPRDHLLSIMRLFVARVFIPARMEWRKIWRIANTTRFGELLVPEYDFRMLYPESHTRK